MNLFRASIDTRHQNAVVANINQFDNAVLELQVLSDGQVSEPWINPRFRLIGIKKDGNEVEQTSNIDIINATDHIIQIKLKEQMTTCRGMVKMQLIINEDDRTSTSIFYVSVAQSIENQVIESHRDVKTLDELEAYIAQGRKVIAEAEEIATNLKNEMSEFNQEAKASESERQANELNRAAKELIRIDNEEDRVANESERVANEEIRVENEEDRVANEQDRVVNETNRRIAENTRNAQERARQEAELQRNAIFEENENLRKENEKGRIANENDRKKKFSAWEDRETVRLKSEENRILQEQDRVESEEQREQNEVIRQQQESHRQQTYNQFNDSESTRQANEVERQKAEQQRAQAESIRNETFNQSQDDRNRQYAESEEVRNNAFEQNEANRQVEYTQAERDRVESEELRKAREREREDAESQRAQAESNRDAAESERIENFNTAIANANNTMNEATASFNQAINNATSEVDKAVELAESSIQNIENRADACIPIIEQSADEIAQARVDYTGTTHDSIKETNDANVEYVLGEVNHLHYEGQHITAENSIAGQAKNAILKGQTLVNLVPRKIIDHIASSDWDGYCCLVQNSKQSFEQWRTLQDLKPNTKYYISCYVETFEDANNKDYYLNNPSVESIFGDSMIVNGVGRYQWLSTTKSELTDEIFIVLRSQNANARGAIKIKNIMIIEYQDGMENWDIPYFEGMQSVKMPVLKSVGKNLFDMNVMETNKSGDGWTYKRTGNLIHFTSDGTKAFQQYNLDITKHLVNKIKLGKTYYFTSDISKNITNDAKSICQLMITNKDGSMLYYQAPRIFTLEKEIEKIHIRIIGHNLNQTGFPSDYTVKNIQLEEGSAATSFEPYKSNTLSTPEEVVLRSLPNGVYDTLNLNTGEYVQRIGEVVFDGSSDEVMWFNSGWANGECAACYWNVNAMKLPNKKGGIKNMLCDTVPTVVSSIVSEGGIITREGIWGEVGSSVMYISLNKTKLTELSTNGFRQWASQNPITVQYELETPIVKTVDLSDNYVYSYKDVTHYNCYSEEGSLVPTLWIDVPTNLPAVVARQRATIQELEKENVALKNEIEETANFSVNGDLELMSSQFELYFRLFEIEMNLDMPMMATMRGVKSMAMTVYQQAKILILAGKYEREDMEYKLNRYKAAGRITVEEYEELIALMDAQELVK